MSARECALGLLFGVGLSLGACTPSGAQKPNVILVMIDTLRANHLSHYGYPLETAVALDGFKAQSTFFEHAYAPAPWTGPSVASLLTGLFTARHGANGHGSELPDEAVTLAELLRDHGWTTFGISFNPEVSSETRYDQGFEQWDDHLGAARRYPDIGKMLERVETWLDGEPSLPFFLYLQPMNCHGPYRTPLRAQSALLGRKPSSEFVYYGTQMKAILQQEAEREVSKAYVASLVEQYDTAIRYTTDRVARFFESLRARGLYDDALIILTSDHGEELFDHGGFSHGYSLYDEVLHIPLYIKLPHQTEGRKISERVVLMDIYPTLLEILRLRVDHPLDGRSLLEHLGAEVRDAQPSPLRTRLHQTAWTQRCDARAIVSGKYKLVEIVRDWTSPLPRTLLFDLALDPRETKNLAAGRPDLVDRLRAKLDDRFAHYAALALAEPENVLERMDQERLRALGYLD